MNKIKRVLFLMLFILAGSCEKIVYAPDNPICGLPTHVLMHKGCGSDNPNFIENTLAAAEFGLNTLDGIEVDIQISKDGTLWLDHNNEVTDCEGNIIGCFQQMTDDEIREYEKCNDTIRYNTLESVFELMSTRYPASFISLDIKGQYCEIANTKEIMNQMAVAVLDLVEKYKMGNKVLVESSSIEFMSELENQNSVAQCVITVSGDVDEGLANAQVADARGISLKYGIEEFNSDVVSLIHKKGYGIMVWYINEPADISIAWNAHPDFIQTDNADFKKYIPISK
jgi:glycerophosphoryl diester phosphodiesterase